jgi:hypothetical protein
MKFEKIPILSVIFISTALLGQSLLIFPTSGLPITFSWIMIVSILMNLNSVSANSGATFLCAHLFVLLTAAANLTRLDITDFFRSYASFVVFSLILLALANGRPNPKSILPYAMPAIAIIVTIFTLLQLISFMVFGDSSFWFFLDSYSISTATSVDRFEAANYLGYIRPISIFHEPSYLALISLVSLSLSSKPSVSLWVRWLFHINILLSFSTLILPFYLTYLFLTGGTKSKVMILIFMAFCILIVGGVAVQGFLRFGEILIPGTSGHERLVVPILTVLQYWRDYPFGAPLGNVYPQLNNSIAVFLCYFGTFSVPIAVYLVVSVEGRKLPIYLALLLTNGAFFTAEMALLVYLTSAYGESQNG